MSVDPTNQSPESSETASSSIQQSTVLIPRSGLPPFPPFDPLSNPANTGPRWRKWLRRFENLLVSLRETDPVVKRGLLLTYVGEATNDIFDTLPTTGTDYAAAVESLTQRFDPSTNKDMEIYEFRQITQGAGETLNEFHRRLKEKSSLCEFTNEEAEIRTQIIHKTSDNRLRRKALREEMDLKSLLTYGLALEKSDRHSKLLEEDNKTLRQTHYVGGRKTQERQRGHSSQNKNNRYNPITKLNAQKCRNCGGSYPHIGGQSACPAAGKKCFECGKTGHFGKHCMSKQKQKTHPRHHDQQQHHHHQQRYRHQIEQQQQQQKPQQHHRRNVHGLSEQQQSDTDEEFIYTITPSEKAPEITIKVAEVPVQVTIDTGSSVNILNNEHFKKIKQQNPTINLQPTKTKVFAYGAKYPLYLLGQFTAEIEHNSKRVAGIFLVTKQNNTCLLSYNTSTDLGLLNINVNTISVDHPNPKIAQILQQHHKVFQGMGNLKNCEVTLEIDPTVTPVAQNSRRLPHSMRKKVNEKLQGMKEQDIIEKVDGITPWLSPLIPIPKKGGDLRLVLDMRVPNQALQRRRVQFPTVDDILHRMEGATIFTEVDLSQGYLQISLAKESRSITAFQTPDDGPYQFKRLIMGACPSGEYFHEIIHNLIKHIPNCQNISDNIWLWSKDITEHAKQLNELLQTIEESGLTLKFPKCSFAVPEINVFGHIVSSRGIRPDNKKIEAVANARTSSQIISRSTLVSWPCQLLFTLRERLQYNYVPIKNAFERENQISLGRGTTKQFP